MREDSREIFPGRQAEKPTNRPAFVMYQAHEDDETHWLAADLGFTPVAPPKSNRVTPWEYDRELYRRRNEVECLFRRLKGFRRIFSRFDKLDVMYLGFVVFALAINALRSANKLWSFLRSHCSTCRWCRMYMILFFLHPEILAKDWEAFPRTLVDQHGLAGQNGHPSGPKSVLDGRTVPAAAVGRHT